MYIVAIAWIFTSLLLAVSQPSLLAALLTLFFWGALPLGLVLWLVGTPARLRRKARSQSRNDANSDQLPPDQ